MNNNEIDKLRMKIAIFNAEEEIKQKSNKCLQNNNEKIGINLIRKKIIATVCASFVLVSGIVVATNIEKVKTHFRGLGEGVDTAIENGYISEPNVEFVNVENIGADVKLENFLMDDVNLSVNFMFDFDENIKDIIDMEKVNNIELSDLIVKDEENRIIYSSPNQEAFEKYCKENNLDYTFCEFNENYMNNGLNAFIVSKSSDSIELMYNMYSKNFPKSKKLYFSFNTITITEYTQEKEIEYEINGVWNATIDVPEKMYNRTEEYYKVVSCDSDDFEVYTSKVTEKGFEIGVIISNIEKPEFDYDKYEKYCIINEAYNKREITLEEYRKSDFVIWFDELEYLLRPISLSNTKLTSKQTEASYIENENGKKFEYVQSPSRKQLNEFLGENKFNFYDTFSMTKKDATQKIKVVLYYYGTPVTVELKKING